MKLHLNRKETSTGLIFKKKVFEVWVKIDVTAEERTAYNECKKEIEHMIIAEFNAPGGLELNLTIKWLWGSTDRGNPGVRFQFSNRAHIPTFEADVKEGVSGFSKHLKDVLAGSGTGEEVTEF